MTTDRQLRCAAVVAVITMLFLTTSAFALDHKAKQPRPIQLGVSGSNITDTCSAGTLGSLVQNKYGRQFILSNNHVLADENRAVRGSLITQPGKLDVNCNSITANKVARLRKYISINFSSGANNLVDAALARTIIGKVDPKGRILGIGQVSATPIDSKVGMRVKKAGRTTGVTTGRISAVNATVDVRYSSGRLARFVNQTLITPGTFSSPGDSGSLIVTQASNCPRPVGLLFGGSSTITVANPIKTVYKKLRVTPVGCGSSTSAMEANMSGGQVLDDAMVVKANAVKSRHEKDLLKIPGVVAVGIGEKDGEAVIKVFVKKQKGDFGAQHVIPDRANGMEIVTEVTEEFVAY